MKIGYVLYTQYTYVYSTHNKHNKQYKHMNEVSRITSNNQLANLLSMSWVEDYINFMDVTEKSIATYKRALKQFVLYLQTNGITAPQREDVIAFREGLKKEHKPTTVQLYMVSVRLFFKWLEQRGLYKNIADNIKGAKLSKEHKKDCLTTKQIKNILTGIDRTTLTGKRDYAIISLMVTGGLRTIEVSRADVEDLRPLGDDTVLYIQGKGRDEKSDYVKVVSEVEDAIRDYLKALGTIKPKSPLFVSTSHNSMGGRLSTRSISGIVKEHFRNAGYDSDRLTAHSLRHTTGTINLQKGGTLEETQQLLRHVHLDTTMIYLHHLQRADNKSEERVASAIF